MPRVRRQVVLEDPARPVTPDMAETKLRTYRLQTTEYFPCNVHIYIHQYYSQ